MKTLAFLLIVGCMMAGVWAVHQTAADLKSATHVIQASLELAKEHR